MSQTSSNIIHLLSQLLFVCTHTQHGHVLFARVHILCIFDCTSIFYLCAKHRSCKNGVGGWEFSPLSTNAKMLNKDSELIFNV